MNMLSSKFIVPPMPLPDVTPVQPTQEQAALHVPKMQIEQTRFTVLVVEDDYNVRELFRDILAPHYTVLTANDGNNGLEMLRQNLPDLVLCDIVMPRLDGNRVD